MNQKQKTVLICMVVLMFLMLAFPPFEMVLDGRIFNLGYGFIFSPPQGISGNINIGLLFIQFLVIIVTGVVGWFLLKNSEDCPD